MRSLTWRAYHILLRLIPFAWIIHPSFTACPASGSKLWRIGRTRYYVAQVKGATGELTDWNGAHKKCTGRFKLASLDSLFEEAVVGRAIEETFKDVKNINNEFRQFWIDAKFDPSKGIYVTKAGKKLRYHNIFNEQYFRAVGHGQDLSEDGSVWKPKGSPEYCLIFGISHPQSLLSKTDWGFESRMREFPCTGKKDAEKRFALCEVVDAASCASTQTDLKPTVMTDARDQYIESGNWIFGYPRRFIVNFEPRTRDAAAKYCDERGMTLYRAGHKDGCFLPSFALWTSRVTTAQFWVDIKFRIEDQQHLYNYEWEITSEVKYTNATLRSDNKMHYTCMVASYSYERKGNNNCNCEWNSMALHPGNCEMGLGTICIVKRDIGPVDGNPGQCASVWGPNENVYIYMGSPEGRQSIINSTATTPFATDVAFSTLYRSTYKQPYGPRLCPRGYSMATEKTKIPTPDKAKMTYPHDAEDTYWIAEYLRGFPLRESECTISVYDQKKKKREIKKNVDCFLWHFYLCEKNA